jgi:hypothetical protein
MIAAFMIYAFSFANENNKEIIIEQTVQNVLVVENQITETIYLSKEDLKKYCWTSSMTWVTGVIVMGSNGELYDEVVTYTWTSCVN